MDKITNDMYQMLLKTIDELNSRIKQCIKDLGYISDQCYNLQLKEINESSLPTREFLINLAEITANVAESKFYCKIASSRLEKIINLDKDD